MLATALRWAACLVLAAAPVLHLAAQEVTCDLRRSADAVLGTCAGFGDRPVEIILRAGTGAVHWSGTMQLGEHAAELDVARYAYADGVADVVRTPFGWFLPSVLDLEGDPPRLAWSLREEAPPSRKDLAVLDQAAELLEDESVWDRADDRVCAPSDDTFSLYCAMAEGVRRVTGEYQHRQPALQIVRRVVAARWGDRVTNHRLMDFNNDPATRLADVRSVLAEARTEILRTIR